MSVGMFAFNHYVTVVSLDKFIVNRVAPLCGKFFDMISIFCKAGTVIYV